MMPQACGNGHRAKPQAPAEDDWRQPSWQMARMTAAAGATQQTQSQDEGQDVELRCLDTGLVWQGMPLQLIT